jgi:hypothetical protein
VDHLENADAPLTVKASNGSFRPVVGVAIAALAWGGLARSAAAATRLTVDLSTTVGPVAHSASGSLYGVTETLPADVTGLIAPLHPNVFVNPATDVQQPVGDAIVVAGRVAPVGGRITIRLADWFTGFYTFTTMADWFDKIGQTASRRQSAHLANIYGYEIWNEPNGTWASTNPLGFNEFWRQTYVQLRQLDPTVKIVGPSISYLDTSFMRSFLSFCQTNSCLPDIVSWHELGGADLTGDIQSYRALEKQLGVGPLPISINEYSGAGHIGVEGQPGASAPLIAKFERFGVDSACISFWDVGHPGRLGSLLATNAAPNGGWWFYKWYGDMAGTMVSTTPPTPSSPTALDGFANVDAAAQRASVVVGGTNDGSLQIVVTGFHAVPFFGSQVHAVVEHTPFVNRTTVVNSTDTVSTADVGVSGDQISVSITGANATDGYRVVLTPVGSDGGAGNDGGAQRDAGTDAAGASDAEAVVGDADGTAGDAAVARVDSGVADGGIEADGARDDAGQALEPLDAGEVRPNAAAEGSGGCSCHAAMRDGGSAWLRLACLGSALLLCRRTRRARRRADS